LAAELAPLDDAAVAVGIRVVGGGTVSIHDTEVLIQMPGQTSFRAGTVTPYFVFGHGVQGVRMTCQVFFFETDRMPRPLVELTGIIGWLDVEED